MRCGGRQSARAKAHAATCKQSCHVVQPMLAAPLHLLARVTMMPFCTLSSSVGRPCSTHSPTSASSTRNLVTCRGRGRFTKVGGVFLFASVLV